MRIETDLDPDAPRQSTAHDILDRQGTRSSHPASACRRQHSRRKRGGPFWLGKRQKGSPKGKKPKRDTHIPETDDVSVVFTVRIEDVWENTVRRTRARPRQHRREPTGTEQAVGEHPDLLRRKGTPTLRRKDEKDRRKGTPTLLDRTMSPRRSFWEYEERG